VAEGIERKAEAAALIEMGCPFGQGFLYSQPMAAQDVPAYLTNHPASA
jgi:EAL domain-containing protein (putative c-di-GMP-specific phosphodiesterase class I)